MSLRQLKAQRQIKQECDGAKMASNPSGTKAKPSPCLLSVRSGIRLTDHKQQSRSGHDGISQRAQMVLQGCHGEAIPLRMEKELDGQEAQG